MNMKEFRKLVKQFDGWIEEDIVRFPSVYQKQQFEKAYELVNNVSNASTA